MWLYLFGVCSPAQPWYHNTIIPVAQSGVLYVRVLEGRMYEMVGDTTLLLCCCSCTFNSRVSRACCCSCTLNSRVSRCYCCCCVSMYVYDAIHGRSMKYEEHDHTIILLMVLFPYYVRKYSLHRGAGGGAPLSVL